jgi:hypothetical protein
MISTRVNPIQVVYTEKTPSVDRLLGAGANQVKMELA